MSNSQTDFDKHKQFLRNNLINQYNRQVSQLNSLLLTNIKTILRLRITQRQKNNAINNLIINYNKSLALLKSNYSNNLNTINSMILPTTILPNINVINNGNNINKVGLVIGINYNGSNYQLYGCVNDANSIINFLSNNEFNNNNINLLTDDNATKTNIINGLSDLLNNTQSGSIAFFFYSGHGSYKRDLNGDEITGYDQCIVPNDFNIIVDDDLKSILTSNLKDGVTLLVLFDCCYSGTALDLKYNYNDTIFGDNYNEYANETETTGNVIMISGCSDYQTSVDTLIDGKNQGALTWAFLQCFSKTITWRQLLIQMRDLLKSNNFSQIPQLTSGKFINIDTNVFI